MHQGSIRTHLRTLTFLIFFQDVICHSKTVCGFLRPLNHRPIDNSYRHHQPFRLQQKTLSSSPLTIVEHTHHEHDEDAVPLTLISGLQSQDKVDLIKHIINQSISHHQRLGIVVNCIEDLSCLSSDGASQKEQVGQGIEIQEGYAWACAIGSTSSKEEESSIADAINKLLGHEGEGEERQGHKHRHHHHLSGLLVENPSTLEPLQQIDILESQLCSHVRLDTFITVLDTSTFLSEWAKADSLFERKLVEEEEDYRTIPDLLVSQIECANIIVLTKVDREDSRMIEEVMHALNPSAKVHTSISSIKEVKEVIGTGALRDVHELEEESAGWLQLLNQATEPDSNSKVGQGEGKSLTTTAATTSPPKQKKASKGGGEGKGSVWTMVYHARKPFHPQRLWDLLVQGKGQMETVLRSKGFFWLASRNDDMGLWSQAGGSFTAGSGGPWWVIADEEEWPEGEVDREDLRSDFEGEYGDRRQELALIGLLNIEGREGEEEGVKGKSGPLAIGGEEEGSVERVKREIKRALDECLLNDEEIEQGSEEWMKLSDPFPEW